MTANHYITLFFVWMGHFFVDVMIGFWPIFKTMAELDLAVAGMICAGCAFLGEGLQIYFGSLSDSGYRRPLIAFGVALAACCTLLPYTQSYLLLFILFLFTCIGSGAFHPSAVSLTGQLSKTNKSLLIAIFACGGSFGLASSHLIFSNAYYYLEGNTVILAFPLLLLSGAIALTKSPQSAVTATPNKSRKINISAYITLFKRFDIRTLYFTQITSGTVFWGMVFLLPDILTSRGYDSWVRLGGAHMALILGGAFMMIPAGYLADRFSSRTVIFFSFLLSIGLLYSFLFSPFLSNGPLLMILFALGAANGVINPVAVAMGNKLVPENPGIVSAILMGLVWCVAEGLGAAGGGLLSKLFTEDAPASALAVIGSSLLAGVWVCLKLPADEQVRQTETITS